MILFSRPFLIIGISLLGLGAAGAEFVRPAEGPIPFRRDRLPLSAESVSRLSRSLAIFAGVGGVETAEGRRAYAQRLALAVALDPGNRAAREMLDAGLEGRVVSDEAEAGRLVTWGWEVLEWVESPDAGRDGRALAACLRDILVVLDPEHPVAQVAGSGAEGGEWDGWVAGLAMFSKEDSVVMEEDVVTEDVAGDTGGDVKLKTAMVRTVLWTADEEKNVVLKVVPVTMEVEPVVPEEGKKGVPFTFRLADFEEPGRLKGMVRNVSGALASRHEEVPMNQVAVLKLGTKGAYDFRRNRDAISASAAVLMDSALSGQAGEAVVLGVLDSAGNYGLTSDFWNKIRHLAAAPGGGRLVVPAEAAEWLPSVLALEDPGFFLKYEVIVASNLEELVERTRMEPEAGFVELKAASASATTIPIFLSQPAVRQGFANIFAACPWHVSAKLLALQGAGGRPTTLPRHILAVELRKALEPVAKVAWVQGNDGLDTKALDAAFQESRDAVDGFERYVDIRDRDLHGQARDLALSVRTYARKGNSELSTQNLAAWKAFEQGRTRTLARLAMEVRDPEEPEVDKEEE